MQIAMADMAYMMADMAYMMADMAYMMAYTSCMDSRIGSGKPSEDRGDMYYQRSEHIMRRANGKS